MTIKRDKNSYKNFNVSTYLPVANVNGIKDKADFERKFKLLSDYVKIGKVYIEDFRAMQWATKEQILMVKGFFDELGIETSGGITTCVQDKEGFSSLCYSDEESVEVLRKAVALNAEIFDEFIFDDFFFLNCRCNKCIAKKGNRSWSQFRLEEKEWLDKEIVMKTAKEINPNINVILKYPQWYEVFNETGYDLKMEPAIFDSIFTGTETRNPDYCQQHLPKYLSYFIMRYLESAAPDRNLGGWFDPFECTYNLSSYIEQGHLTLFAKAKEIMLFCYGALSIDSQFRNFAPSLSQMFEEVDEYLDKLGNPIGAAAYRPHNARGEDNLHNYLGMCGIPFEPYINYPENESVIFLDEGAAYDDGIINKMKKSMQNGADVIVTSGFVRKLGDEFKDIVNVSYSDRKAFVSEYAATRDNGITVNGMHLGKDKIIIPQLDYCTNDIWELAAAYANANNFPIVLRCLYGDGHICIVTIPDNMGDVYEYPTAVLNVIRGLFCKNMPVSLSCQAGVQLFAYDNDTVIVRSDLPYYDDITININGDYNSVKDMVTGWEFKVENKQVTLHMAPMLNYVLKLQK